MKIITLTLNPAVDAHLYTHHLHLGEENFCEITRKETGGKGINISRALYSYGIVSEMVVVLGKDNGAPFLKALERQGLQPIVFSAEGAIRENMTIHTETGEETRISFDGFSIDKKQFDAIKQELLSLSDAQTVLAFAGSLPKGLDTQWAKEFLMELGQRGVRIVVDCRNFSLKDLLEIRPWLIKPNEQEMEALTGQAILSVEQAVTAARDLYKKGISNVMISLGEKGAVLCSEQGCFHALPPTICPISSIGAGDASVAGFMVGAMQSGESAEQLRYAVSFGTAACLTEGTLPPQKQQICQLLSTVTVKRKG